MNSLLKNLSSLHLPKTLFYPKHLHKLHSQSQILSSSSSWNSLIRTSLEPPSTSNQHFLSLYKQMLHQNIPPDITTFCLLLRAPLSENRLGEAFHSQILRLGFGYDKFLLTGLLLFYTKGGDLGSARKLFDEMPERDVIANNVMIVALGKNGFVAEARRLFDEMPVKNSSSWNSMITCYSRLGDLDSAREIFDKNPVKDVVSWNAMIDGYCKAGESMVARELFDKMGNVKNTITWNTMITGCVRCREFGKGISLFREMEAENVKPNEVTMIGLLSACAHTGALDMGNCIYHYVRRRNFKADVVLGNALIDMFCKCGSIEDALNVFDQLPVKNVFCWNSIIVGLGMHGYGKEAINAFLEMKHNGINPDGITFVGVLSACSHSGLVFEAREYFSQMLDVYGVQPGIEHYGCIVDLLGRAGFLEEALHLILAMPIPPNIVVWGSLLRGCQIHKDTKLSEKVTKHLLELDPSDGANYVFMSNIYASVNRWDDVELCRKLMYKNGVHKSPGFSSIEVDNVVHKFIIGETSHPQFAEIISFLDEIAKKLKRLGHDPNMSSVLHDIDVEEKESAVRYHTEMIAVAFGLMSTPQEKPIRVVKNLRGCSDCHASLKLISDIYKRHIVVRDKNRFHHFRDGSCSCNDYW